MGGGVCFTVFISSSPENCDFFSLDEVKLYDGARIKIKSKFPVLRHEEGHPSQWVPLCGEYYRVRDSLFLIGGVREPRHPTATDSDWEDPSNWLWSAPFPKGASKFGTSDSNSLTVNWTRTGRRPMLVGRHLSVVLPLPEDEKIFICGGDSGPEDWVDIYSIRTGEFEHKEAPPYVCEEHPNASFLWWKSDETGTGVQHHQKGKPLIMVYYHGCPPEFYEGNIGLAHHPKLYSYDMVQNIWELKCTNLPAPRPEHFRFRRTLIYVGGDILFILDSLSFWYVYNLSLDKVMGKVEVNGYDKESPVIHALYLDSSYNVNGASTDGMTFCLFAPDAYEDGGYMDIAYAKVRVKFKDGEYVAKLQSKATLKVGWYCDFSVFADRTSHKGVRELLKKRMRRLLASIR